MMAVSSVRRKIRNYFFRKITLLGLKLTLLKLSVISALLSLTASTTRYLMRIWTEYGAPQPRENVRDLDPIEGSMKKSIRELKPDYTGSMDYEKEILHECPVCESNIWNIKACFDDYEIATYFLDMECSVCGTYATAPTPLDRH